MEPKKVSVIIVNYKNKETVLRLKNACLQDHAVLEVIIVDNSGEIDNIAENNRGFAKACNEGAQKANGELLAFINPDIEIHGNEITQLIAHKKTAVIAPVLINSDGSFQQNAGYFPKWSLLFWKRMRMNPIHLQKAPTAQITIDWVTGGFMIIDKKVFDAVGGFDERYFMYWEDVDLCLRLKKNKQKILFDGSVRVVHNEHSSVNQIANTKKNEWYEKSREVFKKQWALF